MRRDPAVARAQILESARGVIAELGPDQAGLKQVAQAAGVSHGLVTHYFGTFSALVDEVLESQMVGMRDTIVRHVIEAQGDLDVRELIRKVFLELKEPTNGRLMTWAFLTGRLETMASFVERNQGMRAVSDAFQSRGEARSKALESGELDRLLVLVWCALAAYAVAGPTLWKAVGGGSLSEEERDEEYLSMLTDFVLYKATASGG